MNITQRTQEIKAAFALGEATRVSGCNIKINPYWFTAVTGTEEIRKVQQQLNPTDFYTQTDDLVNENKNFHYSIFTPAGQKEQYREAILLLHGLNERCWDKYFPWVEALVEKTGKPVILFPLAFHMNRTPEAWRNPRAVMSWLKSRTPAAENTTFANLVLSDRLCSHPLRFYCSGLESVYNIIQLCSEIRNGEHPLFLENTKVNIFAYSIGAFISQIMLLANPRDLFNDARLFMFCGGSIFSEMNGSARDIMDEAANERIQSYYRNEFLDTSHPGISEQEILEQSFKMMIRQDILRTPRELHFRRLQQQVRGISLKKDTVIPTSGIISALGDSLRGNVEEMDFPYPYTHQVPFPSNPRYQCEVEQSFSNVFEKAGAFL